MFCSHCGAKISETDKYCSNCGKTVTNKDSVNDMASYLKCPKCGSTDTKRSFSDIINGYSAAFMIWLLIVVLMGEKIGGFAILLLILNVILAFFSYKRQDKFPEWKMVCPRCGAKYTVKNPNAKSEK